MKYLKYVLIILLFFVNSLKAEANDNVTIHFFHSDSCRHCIKEKVFLNNLIDEYDNISIKMYEISDFENANLMKEVMNAFGIEKAAVPFTIIGTVNYTAYNANIANMIENTINYYSKQDYFDLVTAIKDGNFMVGTDTFVIDEITTEYINIPILGDVDPKLVSLPLIAVIIGIVDGFNPCAMWVLLFLISMLTLMKDKKRMWILGLTFLTASALIYMFFMFVWLQIAISLIMINWIKIFIGSLAVFVGLFTLYKYFKMLKEEVGCSVVSKEKRNKIFEKIKKFTTEKNIVLAIIGIISLAISVNFIEIMCSAGLPFLFTQILAVNDLTFLEYFIYIIIYILFFLIDDIIVFGIAMITLEKVGLTNKYNKYSYLIGGIIMTLIGILLIFRPELLIFK